MARNVAETRVRIALDDELSIGLLKAQRNITGFNKSITATSGAFGGVVGNITGLTAALTGLYGAIDLTAQAIRSPFEFAKSMETNRLGLAGIMQSMLELNGRSLEWAESLALSDKVMGKLNQRALETAATTSELVESFRALLGPGLSAGMSLDQIVEFSTIGANAVKSIGLNRAQIIQETRDLVQGGIRPQSSTLAVSLGLTDADIAKAKKSSEGLFNFLINRMKGFERSARETPKTAAGLYDQIEEGYTRSTATGAEPLYEYYKDVLGRVANLFLDNQSFKLNESYIEGVREFSEHAVNAAKGLETAGEVAVTILKPAVELTGDALGKLADNTDKIVLGFGAFKAGQTALDLIKVANATQGAYEAQTLLGGVLQRGKGYLNSYSAAAELAARKEISAALNAERTINDSIRKTANERRKQGEVEKAVANLIKTNHQQLATRLKGLAEYYERLGASAEQAAQMQLKVARLVNKSQRGKAIAVIGEQTKHLMMGEAYRKEAAQIERMQKVMLGLGTTIGGLSGAYMALTEDTESFGYELAQTGFAVGAGIDAIGLLIGQLGKLKSAYEAVKIAGIEAGLLNVIGGVGSTAIGIGLGVGAATAGAYAIWNDISVEEMKRRWFAPKTPGWEADMSAVVAAQRRGLKTDINTNGLTVADREKLTKEQEKAQKLLEKMQDKVETLSADVEMKITKHTGTALEYANAQLEKELAKMNEIIGKAQRAGVDQGVLSELEGEIKKYKDLAQAQNQRNDLTKQHDNQMSLLQTLEDTYAEHYSVLDRMRAEELESYRARLLEELQSTKINEEEKLRLRKEYAEATKELNQVQATNLDEAWKQSLDYLKNIQFDQVATVKAGIDEMLGAITNFGQNMLIEQKSFSDQADELFKDLANSIINTMMKVIMQGLVMNSIMSIFGIGGNSKTISMESLTGQKGVLSTLPPVPHFANGGVAHGWAVVGERGRELAHFGQPARIYNAEQTKQILGNGGNVNVKINLSNESGQQLRVEQTGGGFDGESYVVNVVIRALETNKGGLRTIMRGAVAR